MDESEANFVGIFAHYLSDPHFSELYGQSFGLCLEHRAMAASAARSGRTKKLIAQAEREKMRQLYDELEEYVASIRAAAGAASGEFEGAESDAWKRALMKLSIRGSGHLKG